MKIITNELILILLLLIFSGCQANQYEKAKIRYGIEKFVKQSEKCDSTGCASIVLEYPIIKTAYSPTVKDSLTAYILSDLLNNYSAQGEIKTINDMAEMFFNEYEDFQSEFTDYSIPWEINSTISVIYNQNGVVSFQLEFYHFTGGAHGNSGVYFANFNSLDGRKLNLSDLFISQYEIELNRIAERIFRENRELGPDESLQEAGFWFQGNKFSLNDNFGIKNDGLVFYFNS